MSPNIPNHEILGSWQKCIWEVQVFPLSRAKGKSYVVICGTQAPLEHSPISRRKVSSLSIGSLSCQRGLVQALIWFKANEDSFYSCKSLSTYRKRTICIHIAFITLVVLDIMLCKLNKLEKSSGIYYILNSSDQMEWLLHWGWSLNKLSRAKGQWRFTFEQWLWLAVIQISLSQTKC